MAGNDSVTVDIIEWTDYAPSEGAE
jgi:hypothetical protein